MIRTAVVLIAAVAFAPAAILDDFNRPDSNDLGSNWTVVAGGAGITGNRAYGLSSLSLVTYNGVSASNAYVDVYNVGTGLQYAAIVLGYSSESSNYFIKLQNQSGGSQFGNYAFYYGNNGSGGMFADLDEGFSSARIWASYSGTTAWLYIDSNFDGNPDQQYSYTYGSPVSGSGVGLGFYGPSQVDNFGVGEMAEIPEPGSFLLVLPALGVGCLAWLRRR